MHSPHLSDTQRMWNQDGLEKNSTFIATWDLPDAYQLLVSIEVVFDKITWTEYNVRFYINILGITFAY